MNRQYLFAHVLLHLFIMRNVFDSTDMIIFFSVLSQNDNLQLFDSVSSTYTYLLADLTTKEAIIIDPVLEHAKRDSLLINELGFTLKYAGTIALEDSPSLFWGILN